jgi:hypothetical protein
MQPMSDNDSPPAVIETAVRARRSVDSSARRITQSGRGGQARGQKNARRERLTRLHREASGIFATAVIRNEDVAGLLLAASLGNPEAARDFGLICGWFSQALPHVPLCAVCPAELRTTGDLAGFVILMPLVATPTGAVVSRLCARCAERSDAAIVATLSGSLGWRAIDPANIVEGGWA